MLLLGENKTIADCEQFNALFQIALGALQTPVIMFEKAILTLFIAFSK